MTLGEKIQQLRKAAGLSQEQLAAQLGVSRQSVSKWELNEAVPELSKIVALSELFAVSTDELLRDAPPPAPDSAPQTGVLERVTKLNHAQQKMSAGFRTAAVGLILLALEYLFLPIFGAIQKAHVAGQGFYTDFMKYAHMQPMPTVFFLTALVILLGTALFLLGLWEKKRLS